MTSDQMLGCNITCQVSSAWWYQKWQQLCADHSITTRVPAQLLIASHVLCRCRMP